MMTVCAEMICRLAPGTMDLSGVGRGGLAKVDSLDVAMAVGRVSDRVGQLLLLAVFAGQWGKPEEREVVRLLVLRVVDRWAAEECWEVKRVRSQESRVQRQELGGPITRMVRCAVDEVVSPGHCRVCKGIGQVHRKDEYGAVALVRCDARGCVGGLVRRSGRVLAAQCGFEASTWRKCGWDARYDRVGRLVWQCFVTGMSEFNAELGC